MLANGAVPMTVEEIQALSGRVVELPPFEDGTPLRAKLRRASLFGLIFAGKIPNELLAIAHQAAEKGMSPANFEPQELPKLGQLMDLFCSAAMVEPKWQQVRDYLTDEQIQAIMAYATGGMKALTSFRRGYAEPPAFGDGSEDVRGTA